MQPSSLPRIERRAATSEDGPAKCHGGYMLRFTRAVKIEAITAAAFRAGIPGGPRRELAIAQWPSRQPHQLQQHGFAGIDQLFQRDAVRAFGSRNAAARSSLAVCGPNIMASA